MKYKSCWGAENTVSSYIKSIELIKEKTRKNYEEMDLENSTLNKEIDAIVEEIESKCNAIIRQLDRYSFD